MIAEVRIPTSSYGIEDFLGAHPEYDPEGPRVPTKILNLTYDLDGSIVATIEVPENVADKLKVWADFRYRSVHN